MQSAQRNWQGSTYQVEGPGQSSSERIAAVSSGKDWPSLQIVCPTSPLYRPLTDNSGPPSAQQVSRSFSQDTGYAGSGYRDTRGGGRGEAAYSGMRSMPYYPAPNTGMMEESSLSYHKMGSGSASYAPSPFGAPSGYRSHIYGTPLTPRGGANALLSPARSPAVHRRFMEPIDGYIYQVNIRFSVSIVSFPQNGIFTSLCELLLRCSSSEPTGTSFWLRRPLATSFRETL